MNFLYTVHCMFFIFVNVYLNSFILFRSFREMVKRNKEAAEKAAATASVTPVTDVVVPPKPVAEKKVSFSS